MTKAPTTGPSSVPSPPTSVISTTCAEVVHSTSVSVARRNTAVFADPASPASAAEIVKISSLWRSTL
jgi:hypothetical protein